MNNTEIIKNRNIKLINRGDGCERVTKSQFIRRSVPLSRLLNVSLLCYPVIIRYNIPVPVLGSGGGHSSIFIIYIKKIENTTSISFLYEAALFLYNRSNNLFFQETEYFQKQGSSVRTSTVK